MARDTRGNDSRWLGEEAGDRRSRILTAAQDVFSEKGFRTAEVQDIAAVAGVSKATIYKEFRSKEEILTTIVEENFRQLQRISLANLVGPEAPLDRLRKVLYAVAAYLEENKAFCRVLVREAGEFMDVVRTRYSDLVRESTPMAEAFFAHLRERGEIPDIPTPDLMKLLTNAGIGILYAWVLTDRGRLVDEVDYYFTVLARLRQGGNASAVSGT